MSEKIGIIDYKFTQQAREKAVAEGMTQMEALRILLSKTSVDDEQIEQELSAFIACNMA
ncbi:hypothetical protein KKE34_05050 [Patescibacteria group bacterium]|nr:hypothetical protein [Patescibacteria group bacterium]MBU1885942.1 hypothetical protein [Patescibacteria group bacterium]